MSPRPRQLKWLVGQGVGSHMVLPVLIILAVGVAAGPAVWRMVYPPLREFCLMQLARVQPGNIAWYVLLLAAAIGFGAALLVLAKHLVASARLRRTIAQNQIATPERLTRISRRRHLEMPIVCVQDAEPHAFCRGVLRPAIVITSALDGALSEAELEAVVLHEAAHARGHDPLRILISRMLAGALFYIPLAHPLRERYLIRLEVLADRAAVQSLGPESLAAALAIMLGAQAPRTLGVAAGIENATEERIRHLLEPDRKLPPPLVRRAEVVASGLLVTGSGLLGGGVTVAVNALIRSGALCNPRV